MMLSRIGASVGGQAPQTAETTRTAHLSNDTSADELKALPDNTIGKRHPYISWRN